MIRRYTVTMDVTVSNKAHTLALARQLQATRFTVSKPPKIDTLEQAIKYLIDYHMPYEVAPQSITLESNK